ncbi:MAG: sugar transferase [Clostridia bacterium]|nr:sugar transferase [Clostridia bacterium]
MYKYIKSILDIIFALIGFILLSPVFLIVVIAIRIDSPGNAIFRQERTGKNGKSFMMYKFRSMLSTEVEFDKEHPVINDDNINLTKVGRFIRKVKLDEAIQLLNIIRGEMSFIGPRPLKIEYLAEYRDWEKMKLMVKPGLGGLAQIKGNGHLEIWERNYYDMKYASEMSFFKDIIIFFKTIMVVLKGEEAYIEHVDKEILTILNGKEEKSEDHL